MGKIDTIELQIDGVKTEFLIMDKETALALSDAVSKLRDLVDINTKQGESIKAIQEAIDKINQKDAETDKTLKSHDERITAANGTADSAVSKFNAISKVVGDNTQKITDEVQRAKDVEGHLDQLVTTPKDNLVAAINWVLDKADKGLENVGTLTELTTVEKTDLVKAVNEVVRDLDSTDRKADQNKNDLGNVAFSVTKDGLLHIEKKEA